MRADHMAKYQIDTAPHEGGKKNAKKDHIPIMRCPRCRRSYQTYRDYRGLHTEYYPAYISYDRMEVCPECSADPVL